jgi:hypothetical protein
VLFVFKPTDTSKPPLRLHASPKLLLFDPTGSPQKYGVYMFQGATHGTGSAVTMMLCLSFAGGDKNESDSDESDEGDIRINDMNEKDS